MPEGVVRWMIIVKSICHKQQNTIFIIRYKKKHKISSHSKATTESASEPLCAASGASVCLFAFTFKLVCL